MNTPSPTWNKLCSSRDGHLEGGALELRDDRDHVLAAVVAGFAGRVFVGVRSTLRRAVLAQLDQRLGDLDGPLAA
jgi:hypothetical protein